MIDEQSTAQCTAELARLLKDARAARGWTLRQAAGHTGISNGYLSLIEQGDVKSPSPRYLMILAEKYGLAFERLMALAGHPSGPRPALTSPADSASAVSATPAITPDGMGWLPPDGDTLAGGVREPALGDDAWVEEPVYGTDLADAPPGDAAQPGATLGTDPRRADTRDTVERRQLTALVVDDMRPLSNADIAQVRAFIAGLRAARRA